MPYKNYTTLKAKSETNILGSSIEKDARIVLGCKAISGVSVADIANENHINRQFVYDQKHKVQNILNKEFNEPKATSPVLILDENTIEKTIVACMLICKGSENDTQEFIEIEILQHGELHY